MRAEISRALLDGLLAEAAASPEQEICGLLFGEPTDPVRTERSRSAYRGRTVCSMSPSTDMQALRTGFDHAQDERGKGVPGRSRLSVAGAIPAANISASPADSFEIDPAALFAALRAERAGGPRLIGHYHSHPHGPPAPSARDAAAALDPGRLWLILGEGRATAWRATPGGPVVGAFEPVALAVTGEGGCLP